MKKVEQSPAAHRRRSGVSALHVCEGGAGSSYGHRPCGSLTEAWAMTACRRAWGSPLCDHRGDGVERRRPCGDGCDRAIPHFVVRSAAGMGAAM